MMEELVAQKKSIKISRRDFPYVIAKGLSGGTTVAGTMMIAHQVRGATHKILSFFQKHATNHSSAEFQFLSRVVLVEFIVKAKEQWTLVPT